MMGKRSVSWREHLKRKRFQPSVELWIPESEVGWICKQLCLHRREKLTLFDVRMLVGHWFNIEKKNAAGMKSDRQIARQIAKELSL